MANLDDSNEFVLVDEPISGEGNPAFGEIDAFSLFLSK